MLMISIFDLGIIILFLLITLSIGLRLKKKITLDDYWVNRRSTRTFVLFCTMLSTNIGGGTVVGVVSMGYIGGLAGAILGCSYALGLILVALIAPSIKKIGDKYECYTLPDFLALRYNQWCRGIGSFVNLIVFFFFMAAQFTALGTFVKILTGWAFITSLIIAAVIIFAYSYVGGLKNDFRTDVFQFFVILLLLFILFPLLVIKAQGFSSLTTLPIGYFTGTAFAGVAFIIVAFLFLGPSIMVSMDIWQRIFAAIDEKTAKRSMILSGIFILPLFFIFALIGMFAKILFPEIDPNMASAQVITSVLPLGLIGIAFCGFLAALMSTADSMLIVASTTITRDFYHGFINKKASKEHLLKLSHRVTLFVGLLGLVIAIAIPSVIQLIINAFSSLAILLPATIGGLFWKRATSKAACWSILSGFLTIIILMWIIPKIAFIPGILISIIVFFILSFITKHNPEENINLMGCQKLSAK